MSYNPNQILGTFFRAGERLTGIICTPAFKGRMVFRPDGGEGGRLRAIISGHQVGYADPRLPFLITIEYEVVLDASINPGRHTLALIEANGVYILRPRP